MSTFAPLSLAVMCATAPALAAEPARASQDEVVLTARVDGSVGLDAAGGAPAAGVAIAAGLPVGPVWMEAEAGVGADLVPTARVAALLGTRVPIPGTGTAPRGLAFTAALGTGWWVDDPKPLARLGVAYEPPTTSPRFLRFSLAYQVGGGGAGALVGGVGVGWYTKPRARARIATAATEPPPPAPPPPLVVYPPEALVWLPHPICDWVPAAELQEVLPPELAGATVQVRAPGFLPRDVTLDGNGSRMLSLDRAPAFGAVLVVASPGDRVSIAGKAFPIAADGTAVFGAPEGPVEVEVVGGGRRVLLQGAVASGYALWLRAPPPTPLTVTFAPGSSAVPPESEAALRAYAALVGDHQLRIVGSYAPEEVDASRRLGSGRAEALAAALVAAGAPPEAVKVLSAARPPKDAVGDAHRYARIEILADGEAP